MICFMDKTFCSSPGCKGDCGRKMTEEETKRLNEMPDWYPVAYGHFCDEPKTGGVM